MKKFVNYLQIFVVMNIVHTAIVVALVYFAIPNHIMEYVWQNIGNFGVVINVAFFVTILFLEVPYFSDISNEPYATKLLILFGIIALATAVVFCMDMYGDFNIPYEVGLLIPFIALGEIFIFALFHPRYALFCIAIFLTVQAYGGSEANLHVYFSIAKWLCIAGIAGTLVKLLFLTKWSHYVRKSRQSVDA